MLMNTSQCFMEIGNISLKGKSDSSLQDFLGNLGMSEITKSKPSNTYEIVWKNGKSITKKLPFTEDQLKQYRKEKQDRLNYIQSMNEESSVLITGGFLVFDDMGRFNHKVFHPALEWATESEHYERKNRQSKLIQKECSVCGREYFSSGKDKDCGFCSQLN